MAPDADSRRFRRSEIDEILRLARNQPQRSGAVHIRMREKLIEIDDNCMRGGDARATHRRSPRRP
jgi:hypothetical protein